MVLVAAARSDVVGSLLRPPRLLAAREQFAEGRLTTAELKAGEDDAVEEALRLQEAGVAVVTDGEMRRMSFQSQSPRPSSAFHHDDITAPVVDAQHVDRGQAQEARTCA
jgi:5-methyltetrahydropteroyltriglutamate--homocysteine methyltransferase